MHFVNFKVVCKGIVFLIFFLTSCLIFFNSCGLDTYYVIEAPYNTIHEPTTVSGYQDCYFSFYTNEDNSQAGFSFDGTDVYYRIYDSLPEMQTKVSALQNLAISNSEATTSLIKPALSGGYGYRPLKCSSIPSSTLIPRSGDDGENRRVDIRLTNYTDVATFKAYIKVDGLEIGIPLRESGTTFDFGRSGSINQKPASTDSDYSYSSSSSDYKYVAMFAFSVGHDSAYSTYYSNILYLGAVAIDSSSENN